VRNQSRASRRSTARTRRSGFKKAQGALFVPEVNKQFLASGYDETLRVFRGDTVDLIDSIHLNAGPNRVLSVLRSQPGLPFRNCPA
jgi:hypothetical protein